MSTLTQYPLADHIRLVARTLEPMRRDTGALEPMLDIVTPSGDRNIALLAIEGAGIEVAKAARMVLLRLPARQAVLIWEGWTVRKDLPLDDPDHRALRAGRLRPSQLPPHKRGDSITLLAESRAGDRAHAVYYVEPDGSFSQLLSSWDDTAAQQDLQTHMFPLFVAPYLLRRLSAADLTEMRELLGSEPAFQEALQGAAERLVGSGLFGEIIAATDDMRAEASYQAMREAMGWRGK